MKWYDTFHLTMIVAILSISVIRAYYVYPHSHIASYFTLIFGIALSIGARTDWIKFKRRFNQ